MAENILKVYNTSSEKAVECTPYDFKLEKNIQKLIESNMMEFFSIRLLQHEYCIPEGRMDSIGIDENNSPVIFEYKLNINQNVINQGLFYLDWLLEHKADFTLLVQEKLGHEIAKDIDWSQPSVVCIARDFTRYDLHAVKQIDRNIRLIRYTPYKNDILILEQLHSSNNARNNQSTKREQAIDASEKEKSQCVFLETLNKATSEVKELYKSLVDFIDELGDDITSAQQKHYLAYKRFGNFTCIIMQVKQIVVFLKLDPSQAEIDGKFAIDSTNKHHWGTGDLQLVIKNEEDLQKALPLIQKAYEQSWSLATETDKK